MNGRSLDGRVSSTTTAAAAAKTAGRMPQAPASLLVQLPPDELKRYAAAATTAAQSPSSQLAFANHLTQYNSPAGPSRGAATSTVQVSDVALLAASIQERREREARVFMWQQRLIGSGQTVDREILKRALTQFSLPAWLQVLQERHLANRCAYPTCRRRPKRAHLSHSNTILPLDAPRYRISLRRRAIERDERDDAGGENGFCSNACWRRGEWVSRWVLNNGESTRQVQRDVSDETFGSAIRDRHGLGNEVEQGGRWERVMDEEHWTEIELLEDLEDKGDVDRLSDDEEGADKPMSTPAKPKPLSPRMEQSAGASSSDLEEASRRQRPDVLQGQPGVVARQRADQRANAKGTAEGFLSMLDSLVIQERQQSEQASHAAQQPSAANPDVYIKMPAEHDDMLAEFSARGRASDVEGGGAQSSLANLIKASARRADDGLGEVDMSDDAPDDATTAASEEEDSTTARQRRALAEEKRQKRKEEDDLFDLAWQAMSEEKAKGTWEDG